MKQRIRHRRLHWEDLEARKKPHLGGKAFQAEGWARTKPWSKSRPGLPEELHRGQESWNRWGSGVGDILRDNVRAGTVARWTQDFQVIVKTLTSIQRLMESHWNLKAFINSFKTICLAWLYASFRVLGIQQSIGLCVWGQGQEEGFWEGGIRGAGLQKSWTRWEGDCFLLARATWG